MTGSVLVPPSERIRFITLSVPNSPDPRAQFVNLRDSFKRLRRRAFWKRRVSGGVVVYEVTLGRDNLWHVHIHALVQSTYIPWKQLAKAWREISGGTGCHIKLIPTPAVTGYVTKYVTKTSLPPNRQLAASIALRGSRLFQPFGYWHDLESTVPRLQPQCQCGSTSWLYVLPHQTIGQALASQSLPECLTTRARSPAVRRAIDNQLTAEL
jgi:hypothetical protein